ncbi:glycosyltransferase family 9 protein [Kangiella sp. HZ709]|uniref:glycosyltransferase family 9 protein n=1 Tax=Kangiella sp. HZ709 TaxID=2666328 RepID=UPI0012B04385|nr:glycosyltransferase family 9 protein [Kangiella sp. HZ709]MRX28201.1 hypothetical protein [Kangiella sp. HZ709]
MKVVIVRLSAIGDCCLVLPVVKAMLAQNEKISVDWVIGLGAHSLIKNYQHPRLNYIPIKKPRNLKDYLEIKNHFKNQSIDVLLAMQASTRANLIYPCIKATTKIGFDWKRARELQWFFTNENIAFEKEHLHDSFCRFANKLGIDTSRLDWSIDIPSNVRNEVISKFNLSNRYMAINPAASKLERSWSEKRYASIIDWISRKHNIQIVLTGADNDLDKSLASNIEAISDSSIINLVGKTNLTQLASVLEQAEFLIAPDTGPAHIANAVATPVIGLYAVAPSWLSGPYNYKDLVVDKFPQAVEYILKKKYSDNLKWNLRVHDRMAMELISVADVKRKVEQLLFVD